MEFLKEFLESPDFNIDTVAILALALFILINIIIMLAAVRKRLRRPKIVCLIGSTKFKKDYELAVMKESFKGNIVLSVACFTHADNINITKEEKEVFDKLHLEKILIADEVVIVTRPDTVHIGESTAKEMDFARKHNKSIRYFYRQFNYLLKNY